MDRAAPPSRRATLAPLAAARRFVALRRRQRAHAGEDGFILLESIVAIGMIGVLMGALATFTVTAVQGTTELRARQGAVQVATSMMATIGALPPTDLVTGRGSTAVADQFRTAPDAVKPYLTAAATTQVSDSSVAATSGATATLPTVPSAATTLNGVAYTTSVYLGACQTTTAGSCTADGTGTAQLRAVVAVQWSNRACRSGACIYVTTTLVNRAADPVFTIGRGDNPSDPVVDDPGPQRVTLGTTVNLQLVVEDGTGLGPHTWQLTGGALPVGLTLSGSGLVNGTPTVLGGPTSSTVTVTDAFGRTDDGTFTWTVVAAPTITTPPAQNTTRGRSVSLATASTCPNSPCTFAAAGLPAGLSIDTASGTITGTPTTIGTSQVTLSITDAAGAIVQTSPFAWNVVDPPRISGVDAVITTVGVPTNRELAYTCTAGPCTITLSGSVPGLGLSAVSGRTGANATTTLTVQTGSGSVHIGGTVAASAVPTGSTRKTYAVSVTIADAGGATATSSATWTATTTTLVNYALGRSTSQSSVSQSAGSARAVDGSTNGVLANGSVAMTQSEAQPWWQVDLGAPTTIRTVQLFNRTDCCADRLANGMVYLSSTDMTGRTYAQLDADPAVAELPFSTLGNAALALSANDTKARYVRVQLSGADVLQLSEVQVLGPNLAAGRTTSQSSIDYAGNPARAVDGNTDGVYDSGSITHTATSTQPWWQVDLGASATIDAVSVWNRTDCCTDRLTGAVLLFSATDMTGRTWTQLNNDASVTKIAFGTAGVRTTTPVGRAARFVRVQLPSTSNQSILSLAEVQVNGTPP